MQKVSENVEASTFHAHMEKLSTLHRNFVGMILQNAKKPKNTRRYSPDGRLLCISIYKISAATYEYLSTFLPIPAPRRVRQVLTKIRLDCGLIKTMEDCLKETANRVTDEREKACVLMGDEVSLKLNLQYCSRKDKVIGVEDWGNNRTSNYSDHALVFMLRGIKSRWKIPLTYNFCARQITRVKKRVSERVLRKAMHIIRSESLGRRLASAKSLA